MTRWKNIAGRPPHPGSRLTPLYPTEERRGAAQAMVWLCRCECGRTHQATQGMLVSGNVRSCGCLHRDRVREAQKAKRDSAREAAIERLSRLGVPQREIARRYGHSHQWVHFILARLRREKDGRRKENKRRKTA